jgi:hypothetical protein
MAWKPKVTVAVVIEHDRKVLIVEERIMLFDQSADHQEPNESLQEAEILKESADESKPQYLITFSTGMRLCMALLPAPHLRRTRPRPLLGRTLNADLIRSI